MTMRGDGRDERRRPPANAEQELEMREEREIVKSVRGKFSVKLAGKD